MLELASPSPFSKRAGDCRDWTIGRCPGFRWNAPGYCWRHWRRHRRFSGRHIAFTTDFSFFGTNIGTRWTAEGL